MSDTTWAAPASSRKATNGRLKTCARKGFSPVISEDRPMGYQKLINMNGVPALGVAQF